MKSAASLGGSPTITFSSFSKGSLCFLLKGLVTPQSPRIPSRVRSFQRAVWPERLLVGIHQLYDQEPWFYWPQVANHCSAIKCSFCLYENKRWFATYLEATLPAKSKVVGVGITRKKKKSFENVKMSISPQCYSASFKKGAEGNSGSHSPRCLC